MYLLDTNVVSETRKPRPHGAVLAWLKLIPSAQLYISSVTLGELQRGVENIRKHDPEKAREIHSWIDRLSGSLEIIPPDGPIFRTWAIWMQGRAMHKWEDALIAVTAHMRGFTVVTRNTKDFAQFGVPILDPFTNDASAGRPH